MITRLLLHGPAIKASRIKLQGLRSKFTTNNVVVFEPGSNMQTLLGSLSTPSLFPEEQLYILENPPEDFSNYTLYPIPYTLILWFDHEVNAKKWPDFKELFFPESKEISIFPFLDLLASRDQKAFLEIEKLKKAGFDIYYFLTMILYLLRNLAVTPKNAPAFVLDKLQRQKRNFTGQQLINLYLDILEIDFKIKSGLLEKDQAEFLLINKFIGKPNPSAFHSSDLNPAG